MMSKAGHTGRLNAVRPTVQVIDNNRPNLSTLRVSPNYRLSLLNVSMRADASPYFTFGLLGQLAKACQTIKGFESAPFRFRCISSDRTNVFSLGGDLRLFLRSIQSRDRQSLLEYGYLACDVIFENLSGSGYEDLCSVALVRGDALGGGFEAALSSHILVSEADAHFGFPEAIFGLYPGMGAEVLLSARATPEIAKKLVSSTRRYSARELFAMGVIDVLTKPGEGELTVREIAQNSAPAKLARLRKRFSAISIDRLYAGVELWVEDTLGLSQKNQKIVQFLIRAQERHIRLNKEGTVPAPELCKVSEASRHV